MVTGYLKPDSGRIIFDGRDIVGLSPRQITRLGVSRSFQIPQLFQTLSVRDNLLIAESIAAAPDPQAATEAVLARFELARLRGAAGRIAARGHPQAARRRHGAVEPLAAAAARRADQRRLGRREVRHHGRRDGRGARRRRDGDLRRARHGHRRALRRPRGRVLRRRHHRRRAARRPCCAWPTCAAT